MTLFENIELARKFGGKAAILESAEAAQPNKTATALETAKRLRESKPEEAKPVMLAAMPLAN